MVYISILFGLLPLLVLIVDCKLLLSLDRVSNRDSFVFSIEKNDQKSRLGSLNRFVRSIRPVQSKPEISFVHIHSDIRYRYARTNIYSEVRNDNSQVPNEVNFQAVLPDTAFISKFIMEIDGISYKAEVKPKEEAKDIYKKAQRQGQTAGLVEINSRNANIFNLNINIKAGSIINFQLSYEELLSRKFGLYELTINLISDQISRTKDFQIEVTILDSQDITTLQVPKIRNEFESEYVEENKDALVDRSGKMARVTWIAKYDDLKQASIFSKSEIGRFTIKYDVKRETEGGEILLMNGYFVHFFAPENVRPLRKHVIYVLDTSGSMQGRKIEQLRSAMIFVLDDLKPEDFFNIVTFSSDVRVWRPEPLNEINDHNTPIPVNERNLDVADKYIRKLQAMGGTNINEALMQSFILTSRGKQIWANDEKYIETIIIFLTDGQPTVGTINLDGILNNVQSRNRELQIPIYSLAFGSGADFNFLRKLSSQNHGFARKIYEAGDADLQLKGFYTEISSPLLSRVNFKYTSPQHGNSYEPPYDQTCNSFRNMFRGTELIVAGRYNTYRQNNRKRRSMDNSDEINVSITASGRDGKINFGASSPVRTTMIIWPGPWPYPWPRPWPYPRPWPTHRPTQPTTTRRPTAEAEEDYFLERLWAYLTIKQLIERDISGLRDKDQELDRYSGVFVQNPKDRALKLALKYELVTPLTSLIIVKPDNLPVNEIPFYPLEYGEVLNKPVNQNQGSPQFIKSERMLAKRPQVIQQQQAAGSLDSMVISNRKNQLQMPAAVAESAAPAPPPSSQNYADSLGASIESDDYSPVEKKKKSKVKDISKADIKDKEKISQLPTPGTELTLDHISWLKRRTIWIDNVSYKVFVSNSTFGSGSDPPREIAQDCSIKSIGKFGRCVHLKNCVVKEYLNDKDNYINNYFCVLKYGSAENFAGTCCEKDQKFTMKK